MLRGKGGLIGCIRPWCLIWAPKSNNPQERGFSFPTAFMQSTITDLISLFLLCQILIIFDYCSLSFGKSRTAYVLSYCCCCLKHGVLARRSEILRLYLVFAGCKASTSLSDNSSWPIGLSLENTFRLLKNDAVASFLSSNLLFSSLLRRFNTATTSSGRRGRSCNCIAD